MRKALVAGLAVSAALLMGTFAGAARADGNFDCDEGYSLCAEVSDSIGYNGAYTGHDEPSLGFYSNQAGAGNSSLYKLTIPAESPILPNQQGTGGTWNFQLHPAFWFGMALCDNESAPEYTHDPCVPVSDTNIKDGSNPADADYIGKHAGTAFLELQFYPPGWAPWPPGVSCDAHKWCAAMAVFSLNIDYNNGVQNNQNCRETVGVEPVNFAFITLSGTPHAPPSPLLATDDTFTPNPSTDLFMNARDQLIIDIHNGADGLVTSINDTTTGQTGSMTASLANQFAQVNFRPSDPACSQTPYAFRPMYSTASEHTRVPWAAHTYNIAFSDEIGHFDYCADVPDNGGPCNDPGSEEDMGYCFGADYSLLVQIGGCLDTDNDFDGSSYQKVWPGAGGNPNKQADPIVFTSPLFNSSQDYSRVAFEADLPRIEAADFGGNCNRTTGEHCVNPPPGADFYPIYTTGKVNTRHVPGPNRSHDCVWRFGGKHLPNKQDDFGGNSTTEYGSLLLSNYPGAGFNPVFRYNNFRQVLSSNPCPAS